ncbi:MAG TPA: CehA/McbA family metallohydrolase [Polyangiales bacterium]|nr:CehA/McbA family metallohydrolase [Polyangiales bacterium]
MSLPSRTRSLLCCLGLLIGVPALADDALDEDMGGPLPSARDNRPRGAPPPMMAPAREPELKSEPEVKSEPLAAVQAPKRREARAIHARNPWAIVSEHVHEQAIDDIPEPPGPHRFAPLGQLEIAGTVYYPYTFDGHVHSEHSPDADHPVVDMLARAEREGLSALVLTDHGSSRSALSFPKYKGPLKAFVGQEIGGEYGHAVWWNVDAPWGGSRQTLAQRAAFAHERGGLIVLCHPGWWIGGREHDPMLWVRPDALRDGGISGDIDALEIWNGVYDRPLPKLIDAWVDALEAGIYVPVVGNSDFHRFRSHRLGGPRNVVLCDKPDVGSCLWSAIKAGRLYVTDGPTLNLTVNGKTFGEQVAHGLLDVSLEAVSPRGGELRLYVGRELAKAWSLRPDVREQFHWSGAPTAASSYVRVEIVRTLPGREAPVYELISNPVLTR